MMESIGEHHSCFISINRQHSTCFFRFLLFLAFKADHPIPSPPPCVLLYPKHSGAVIHYVVLIKIGIVTFEKQQIDVNFETRFLVIIRRVFVFQTWLHRSGSFSTFECEGEYWNEFEPKSSLSYWELQLVSFAPSNRDFCANKRIPSRQDVKHKIREKLYVEYTKIVCFALSFSILW